MSLVFQRDVKAAEAKSHCPYCGSISEWQTSDDVHWSVNTPLCIIYQSAKIYSMKCGMVYRRVTEVTEVDQPTIPGLPNYWSQRPSFGRSGFDNESPKMGPFLKRKRTMESWEELSLSEEVRSFKRVRILSNIKKTRKAAFASWEDKESWSVRGNDRTDIVARDDRMGAKSTPTAEVDAPFRTLVTESIILSGATFFSNDDHKSRLAQPRNTAEAQVSDSDHRLERENVKARALYARKLGKDRAELLRLLPSGPILAPILEPTLGICRVLDIGSSNTWPPMGKLANSMFRFFQALSCRRFGVASNVCTPTPI